MGMINEIYLFQWNFAHVKILLNRTLKIVGFAFIVGNQNLLLTLAF